jgi:glycerol-3-phosphate acyltransferase PlsY
MAFYISKFKKIDLNKAGTGALTTSNTVTQVGWKAGLLVFFHDAFKAVFAILLIKLIYPSETLVHWIAGFSAVLGHIFPFYNKFKGGKRHATYIGVIFTMAPLYALSITPIVIATILISNYIIFGSLTTTVAITAYLLFTKQWLAAILSLIPFAVIILKHLDNIKRIIKGTEKKFLTSFNKKDKNDYLNSSNENEN